MCSIIYELLISTVSSYFLGDSVRQFSIIIGFYLAAMGFGSWLSRFFKKDLLFSFIWIELLLGLVGAFSVPLCYIYFAYADFTGFNIFILGLVSIIGTLTGLEVPLLTQLLQKDSLQSSELSDVLTLDYVGALVATLLFPFVLIPFMGVYKSSLLFGFINIVIGFANFIFFRSIFKSNRKRDAILWLVSLIFIALIAFTAFRANEFIERWNTSVFKHPVIYNDASPYQNIVLTDNGTEFRLYLNSAIQFSSRDEYRYHEALVHVPSMQVPAVKKVAILGGGEGLALREVLKYSDLERVVLVELDPKIVEISREFAQLKALNRASLEDERVEIINDDAFVWLMQNEEKFDVVIADLPDPTNESLSRLYSISFYNLVQNALSGTGVFVTQATSPELSPTAFWCIEETLRSSGFEYAYPYHINVPSFGNWGFVLASQNALTFQVKPELDLDFIETESLDHIFYFPPDVQKNTVEVEANRLDRPIIMDYYLKHWRSLNAEKI
jgi:spermidine synthase